MRNRRPRYGRIERLAEEILARAEIKSPPVPVDRIASIYGIDVQVTGLGEVSGLVVRQSDKIIIGVNKNHAPTRRRFTIAHELAHALLHKGEEVRFDKDFRVNLRSEVSALGIDVEEIEANFFAACLLMPRRFLELDPAAAVLDVEDPQAIASLAKRYKVSPHAMSIRLGNLAVGLD